MISKDYLASARRFTDSNIACPVHLQTDLSQSDINSTFEFKSRGVWRSQIYAKSGKKPMRDGFTVRGIWLFCNRHVLWEGLENGNVSEHNWVYSKLSNHEVWTDLR